MKDINNMALEDATWESKAEKGVGGLEGEDRVFPTSIGWRTAFVRCYLYLNTSQFEKC